MCMKNKTGVLHDDQSNMLVLALPLYLIIQTNQSKEEI